ncbi:MAG: PEP/pyruvate-binding domain-containing protein [Candidatus Diapherotrites archaeon]
MKELVLSFKYLNKKSVSIAGGKGAQLGEMLSAGINVPNGFVVLTHSFDLFLKENELEKRIEEELKKAKTKDTKSIDKASKNIRAMVEKGLMPEEIKKNILFEFKKMNLNFVAVRSSATAEDSADASWAGELDTYTNETEKTVLNAVKKCWSSLFTPRAIFYSKEKKFKGKISVGVVVQKMVDSEVAGVAFTRHPITKNNNQIMIEAGLGLGESVVSGAITPDNYIINKKEMFIEEIQVNEQKKMITKKKKEKQLKLLFQRISKACRNLKGKK